MAGAIHFPLTSAGGGVVCINIFKTFQAFNEQQQYANVEEHTASGTQLVGRKVISSFGFLFSSLFLLLCCQCFYRSAAMNQAENAAILSINSDNFSFSQFHNF